MAVQAADDADAAADDGADGRWQQLWQSLEKGGGKSSGKGAKGKGKGKAAWGGDYSVPSPGPVGNNLVDQKTSSHHARAAGR